VPEEIRFCLEKATFRAQSGRPGSVLVDIPHNLQASQIDPEAMRSFYHSDEYVLAIGKSPRPDTSVVRRIVSMLAEAKRPVVLAGGGVASVRGSGVFRTLVHNCDLPVVASLRGLDAIGHDDEHYCGFIGSYGNRHANSAIADSDLLLVLGSRLDERQTGEDRSAFAEGAQIVHVDIDPVELNHNVRETISICCDVGLFLDELVAEVGDRRFHNTDWLECIHRWEATSPCCSAHLHAGFVDPNEFLHLLSKRVADNAVVCADVGQNMMWVAQSFCLSGDRQLLTSGGHGAMGYSLPAGIGAHFASPERQTICVMGDGGIQMNLQELQTISRQQIPVKVFIMNNMSLGMIRDFQTYSNKECFGSVKGYTNPDFERVAYAFDIPFTRITALEDVGCLDRELNTSCPHLFEVVLSPNTHVLPGYVQ
jgi:acetolactate synthase-1/2/3 large subunit